ncbi:MAG: ABC transporter [Nitratiruptor sp.]|nr:ABC transporter [Nitratiruptor sp.]NPA83484.1 ABC transporter ATP-binding protein [Campylobacterota bacterium]
MSSRIAVRVEGVTFLYDQEPILEGIDATIYEGEFIAIIGPNGGGKSTFLKLLLGLLEPTQGRIEIFGLPPAKAGGLIGYTPQHLHHNLEMPLRVIDVVLQGRLGPWKFGFTQEDYAIAHQALQRLGIPHLASQPIAQLSGGQRQRTLIARALATQPKLLVLDEPTAAIDIQGQRHIYQLLKELSITRIVVSHDIKILLEGVDRVFYINKELYIHRNVSVDLDPSGHFCEMELLEELGRSNG